MCTVVNSEVESLSATINTKLLVSRIRVLANIIKFVLTPDIRSTPETLTIIKNVNRRRVCLHKTDIKSEKATVSITNSEREGRLLFYSNRIRYGFLNFTKKCFTFTSDFLRTDNVSLTCKPRTLNITYRIRN